MPAGCHICPTGHLPSRYYPVGPGFLKGRQTLISQEAGAYAARFDGSAYLPHHVTGGLLITPDKESWEIFRREIVTV